MWASEVDHRIQGRPYGTACVEHVINQHDAHIVDAKRNLRASHFWIPSTAPHVVPIESDVNFSTRNVFPFNFFDRCRQATRQEHTACVNAHKSKLIRSLVFFQDLVSNARERPLNRGSIKDRAHHRCPSTTKKSPLANTR